MPENPDLDRPDCDSDLEVSEAQDQFGWSLSNLVALLRQQLFVYRHLYQWLDNPYQASPALEGIHDGQLNSACNP